MILKNLRASREDMDLRQKDVAEIFGVHFSTVSGWETGKDTIPIDRLVGYANEYSLSLDYLFGLVSKNVKYEPINFDLEVLAKNLTDLRNKNGFTQAFVASKLNTSQSAYSHYENANNIIPTSFIYGLTQIYEPFSIDWLFGREKISDK